MRISDWSSDVCSSDLGVGTATGRRENSLDQRMRGHTHFVMLLAVAMAGKFHELGIKRRHLDITHPARYQHALVVHLSFQGFAYHGGIAERALKLGSAWCRERVCQYV